MTVRRLVLASDNAGKLRELQALLAPIDVVSQRALGIGSAAEPFATFIENALAKARHAAAASGLPSLADDSGLCVDALDGAPGVRSARFAGVDASDAANNHRLVARLRGATQRSAHYVCALVALRSADDPEPLVALARWQGTIVDAPRGTQGFGYDPHFQVEGDTRTAAELDPAEKNRISHRGRALAELKRQLEQVWRWPVA